MPKILFFNSDLTDKYTGDAISSLGYEVIAVNSAKELTDKINAGSFDLMVIYANKLINNLDGTITGVKDYLQETAIILATNNPGHYKYVSRNNNAGSYSKYVETCPANLTGLVFCMERVLDKKIKPKGSKPTEVKLLTETERAEIRKKRRLRIIKERVAKINTEITA